MIKIIIVGITDENRFSIIENLSSDSSIIAYTDVSDLYKGYDTFDYVNYINSNTIQNIEYDFIVIAYSTEKYIKKTLMELSGFGICRKKIVVYEYYKDTLIVNPLKKYALSEKKFANIIFGMSHSQCGLQVQYLRETSYKFSVPSADLHIQHNILKWLAENYPKEFEGVKNFIFEMPYYYFNYDLSKFGSFITKRMYYYELFNDYHNFNDNTSINEFKSCMKIFGFDEKDMKYSYNIDYDNEVALASKIYGIKTILKKIWNSVNKNIQIIKTHDNVWNKDYPKTVEENMDIWEKTVRLIKERNCNARIYILIMPFNRFFINRNRNGVKKKRQEFFEILDVYNDSINIIDHFMNGKGLKFSDHCHLEYESSVRYSKEIGEIF